MATRTIQSAGVEIRERDLSLIAPQNVGTNIFIAGYSSQGPTDEVLKISSNDELLAIYGVPTNSAERYFYHGIRELLNSPANIYTSRLPYGENGGSGFGSDYSALVYPVQSYGATTINSVSSFTVSLTFSPILSSLPLSGSGFTFQTSSGAISSVVYAINGSVPATTGNIVVSVPLNANYATIVSNTSAAITLSASGKIANVTTTADSFTINLSGFVAATVTPTVYPSVLVGLEDPNDVMTITSATSAVTTGIGVGSNLDITSGTYVLGDPVHVTLSENEYNQAQQGSLFTWSANATTHAGLSSIQDLGKSGVIILNKSQTSINSQFEGYYIGIADNSNINPASDFNAIIGAKTVSLSSKFTGVGSVGFTTIPNGTLDFSLSSTNVGGVQNSISQILEGLTDYNIDGRDDDDLLNVGVFKLRKSLYATEAYKLDYVLDGKITGSIDSYRKRINPTGGPQTSFFLENVDSNDRNVEILINPYISNKNSGTAVDASGIPLKKIRVLTRSLSGVSSTISGIAANAFPTLIQNLGYADNLYPVGAYSDSQVTKKFLGSIPSKLERALEAIKNDEIYDIDVVVEAGLGTIFAMTKSNNLSYYDDTVTYNAISSLRTSNALDANGTDLIGNYSVIFNTFENFCNLPSNTGGRGDCMFIADPIRQIMIQGKNTKVLSDRTKNFQTDIYWAIRHQFELENTSYAAVYANWAQVYDEFLGDKIWVPFSSVAGATFARNDAAEFPWSAPAGYTRGLVSGNVVDIAITPNQKQRDELYKSNINPVLFSPSQGMAIFGQKTMSKKPSAFDRINVRRLFLALERPTKKAAIFFVFEPNNAFTRTRFVNTLTPIFEYAKQNAGLYDYLIVCDDRNNPPEVIDSNEMKADIYIKPVRTAEFIIVTFTATRTDTNFNELI
jgi:hypothetical protein